MPVTTHDPLDLADKEIDDIIDALGIWANDLLGWEAAELTCLG